jgi:hypothetical protein
MRNKQTLASCLVGLRRKENEKERNEETTKQTKKKQERHE